MDRLQHLSVNVSSGAEQTLPTYLGKMACKGMGLLKIKHSDTIRRPDKRGGVVFSVQHAISSSQVLTKDQVIEMFPDVLTMASALMKANTISGSMNQQS